MNLLSLSVDEKIELSHLEKTVESGLKGAWEAGLALNTINERRLYRETYGTFEAYCQQRWNLARQHAYRLIDAAIAYQNLSPMGDILPSSERQIRGIAALPEEQQQEAWNAAVEIAEGKPTHKHAERAATAVKAKKTPLIEAGQQVEVMDEDNPYYGSTVRVESVKGHIVYATTPDGTKPLLINEVVQLPDKPAPKAKPQVTATTSFESIQAINERLSARVEIVEDVLLSLMEAVEEGDRAKSLELVAQARELFI